MSRQPTPPTRSRPAFARVELAALLLVACLAIAIMTAAADRGRRHAWSAGSLANLQWFAAATTAYGADNGERFWGFSWEAGVKYGDWIAPTFYEAHGNQAVDIIRRRGDPAMPKMTLWFADVLYSPLALYDYLDLEFPVLRGVSPGDRWRLAWAKDREGFLNGDYLPYQPPPTGGSRRWPFSASYQSPPALYDQSPPGARISQAALHSNWSLPGQGVLRQSLLSDAAHPSQKVHLHDAAAWEWRRPAYFGYPEARVALLLMDGSAAIRASRDSNPGWRPNEPAAPDPTIYKYAPAAWEAPLLDQDSEVIIGRYRWTREGIKGRDFGGPEIGP